MSFENYTFLYIDPEPVPPTPTPTPQQYIKHKAVIKFYFIKSPVRNNNICNDIFPVEKRFLSPKATDATLVMSTSRNVIFFNTGSGNDTLSTMVLTDKN